MAGPASPSANSATGASDIAQDVLDFDLRQVTWGYQEIFRQRIEGLVRQGLLGESNPAVTQQLADVLAHSDKSTFDSVLKSFLDALGGQYRWLLRIPRLFERWCALGMRMAAVRHFLGMKFFDACGEGRLGTTPGEIEFVMDTLALLLERQPKLVPAFLDGYPALAAELDQDGVREFVFDALDLARRNEETAAKFLAAKLETSREYIRIKTRRARLGTMQADLQRFAQALTGTEIDIESLGSLDSDDLLERGCVFVACETAIYLPGALDEYNTRSRNETLYKAMVFVACGAILSDGFIRLHGQAGNRTLADWVNRRSQGHPGAPALLAVAEVLRVAHFCRTRFPGGGRLLAPLMEQTENGLNPRRSANRMLAEALAVRARLPEAPPSDREARLAGSLLDIARASSSLEETLDAVLALCEECGLSEPVGIPDPVPLFPDPFFPMQYTAAPAQKAKLDQKTAKHEEHKDNEEPEEEGADEGQDAETKGSGDDQSEQKADKRTGNTVVAGTFYPEWDVHSADYYPDWCCVRERRIGRGRSALPISADIQRYADQIRHIFERLRPEESLEQTRLQEGDSIHLDHFMEYIAERGATGKSEMRFYNKTLINRRDIAVSIILDLSGSTAQEADARTGPHREQAATEKTKTVLQIEKEAAFILASGLQGLGDTFGLFGFTGTSRQNCEFYLFKDFGEAWDTRRRDELLSAFSGSSTRIGAALRHGGWKLRQLPEKTKLILLITDGKPCDQGYDPETRYAHHDVRKACEENRRAGLHTFCISTNENTPADMDLMFPGGRYIILETVARLPTILSKLYLRLTR